MKTIICILIAIVTVNIAVGQQTVKVWGNCDMCKKTIEKAAKAAGAEDAAWDKSTKMLTFTGKADLKKIEQAIALVGYDTQNVRAKDEAYFALPECCQYERKSGSSVAEKSCCKEGKCEKCKAEQCSKEKCTEKKECCR